MSRNHQVLIPIEEYNRLQSLDDQSEKITTLRIERDHWQDQARKPLTTVPVPNVFGFAVDERKIYNHHDFIMAIDRVTHAKLLKAISRHVLVKQEAQPLFKFLNKIFKWV